MNKEHRGLFNSFSLNRRPAKAGLSLTGLALAHLRSSRIAVISILILSALYGAAVFADFITPYAYDDEERMFSYCPPSRIHLFDDEGKFRGPFIYGSKIEFDRYRRRIYREDKSKIYRIRFFARRDKYKFFGLFDWDRCLFSAESPARIYLWGADSRGRDVFSRIVYGSRISLTVGLIGVFISFVIGLLVGGISGFYGGRIDNFIMRLCEMVMMIPGFYLMLALRAAFPANLTSVQIYLLLIFILFSLGFSFFFRRCDNMFFSPNFLRDYKIKIFSCL